MREREGIMDRITLKEDGRGWTPNASSRVSPKYKEKQLFVFS